MVELSSPSCVGWELWVYPCLPAEMDQLLGMVAAPGTLWVELECGQHLREARRCPVPLALPMGDLPLGDPQLAGSSEHSITLGVHTD